MPALGVKVINSSALNPSSNGGIERAVQTVKLMYKKILATRPNYNWDYLNMIVAKVHNTTTNPQNGYKPAELVFGKGSQSCSFLDLKDLVPPHHLVKNKKEHIREITEEVSLLTKVAQEQLEKVRQETAERLNRTRVDKGLKEHDYVFVKDRTEVPGAARPLKTKLDSSPYVVLSVKYATVLVMRLSDGYTSLYSMDDVKKYDSTSPLFSDLPREVAKVLLHDFTNLLSEDFLTLMKYDKLEIPHAIPITERRGAQKERGVDLEEEFKKGLEDELIAKDIEELQRDSKIAGGIKENEKKEDSESEEEDPKEEWKGRLRPRVPRVTFSNQN